MQHKSERIRLSDHVFIGSVLGTGEWYIWGSPEILMARKTLCPHAYWTKNGFDDGWPMLFESEQVAVEYWGSEKHVLDMMAFTKRLNSRS